MSVAWSRVKSFLHPDPSLTYSCRLRVGYLTQGFPFSQRELDTGDIAVSHFSQQAAAATAPAPAPSPPPATSFSHHARVLSSQQAQPSGQPPLPQSNPRGGHAFTPVDRSADLALIDNKAQMFGGTSPQRRVLGSFAGQWTQGGGYDRGRASGPQHQGGAAPGMFGAANVSARIRPRCSIHLVFCAICWF